MLYLRKNNVGTQTKQFFSVKSLNSVILVRRYSVSIGVVQNNLMYFKCEKFHIDSTTFNNVVFVNLSCAAYGHNPPTIEYRRARGSMQQSLVRVNDVKTLTLFNIVLTNQFMVHCLTSCLSIQFVCLFVFYCR